MSVLKKINKRGCGAVVLMVLVAGLPSIGKANLLTLVSSNGLHAIDAYVQQNEADTAHDFSADADNGTDAVLQADSQMSGLNSQSQILLSFNTLFGNGSNQIPLGATITSATLNLWYVNDNRNNDIAMYTLTEDWNENVTWNSLGGGIIAGSNATLARTVNWGSTDPVTVAIDVFDDVAVWSGGANNYGWGFANSNKNGLQITATENTTGGTGWHTPTLEVAYTIPEPAAMGLIAFSCLSLLIGRRLVQT